jgi:hypothetical protein
MPERGMLSAAACEAFVIDQRRRFCVIVRSQLTHEPPSEDSFGRWRALVEQNLCLRQFLAIIEVFVVYIRLCRNNRDRSIASMKKKFTPVGTAFQNLRQG